MIYTIIFSIYILGCILFCIINHSRIGTKDTHSEYWGIEEYVIGPIDIVMESFFWPFMLMVVIFLSPILFGAFLLDKYHNYKTNKQTT